MDAATTDNMRAYDMTKGRETTTADPGKAQDWQPPRKWLGSEIQCRRVEVALHELTPGLGFRGGFRPSNRPDRAPRQRSQFDIPKGPGGLTEFDALGLGGEADVRADAAIIDAGKLGRLGPADGVAGGVGDPARAGVNALVVDAAEVPRGRVGVGVGWADGMARRGDVDLVERALVGVADGGESTLSGAAGDFDVPVAGGIAIIVLGKVERDRGLRHESGAVRHDCKRRSASETYGHFINPNPPPP